MSARSLLCPGCAAVHGAQERFCARCGMPLIDGDGDARVTPRQAMARKIDPRYASGSLVHVAMAGNQFEAEFLAGLLLEEGVPSLVRRMPGFDVPDFMASGPREILVPASGAQAARDALLLDVSDSSSGAAASARAGAPRPAPVRLVAGVLLALAFVVVVLFMATHVWD
jgi:hypothetical protein